MGHPTKKHKTEKNYQNLFIGSKVIQLFVPETGVPLPVFNTKVCYGARAPKRTFFAIN